MDSVKKFLLFYAKLGKISVAELSLNVILRGTKWRRLFW